jgi:tetratricopeptide (TPR) repeat protein
MTNLGINYRDAGRVAEATALLEEVVGRRRKSPAFVRPQLDVVAAALAETYERAGEWARAEPLFREAFTYAKKLFGPAQPRTAQLAAALGRNLLRQRRPAEAEPLLRDALRVLNKWLPDDLGTFDAKSQLGGSLLGQEKYAEAAAAGRLQRPASPPGPDGQGQGPAGRGAGAADRPVRRLGAARAGRGLASETSSIQRRPSAPTLTGRPHQPLNRYDRALSRA